MRLAFYLNDRESIEWHAERLPAIGEELAFGDRGVFRVTGPHVSRLPEAYAGEFKIERIRDSTHEDMAKVMKRGPGTLPVI